MSFQIEFQNIYLLFKIINDWLWIWNGFFFAEKETYSLERFFSRHFDEWPSLNFHYYGKTATIANWNLIDDDRCHWITFIYELREREGR